VEAAARLQLDAGLLERAPHERAVVHHEPDVGVAGRVRLVGV
jgi:hypothetical protein